MVSGPIVQRTGRFPQALLLSAALTLLSALAYLLLVRRPIQATDGSQLAACTSSGEPSIPHQLLHWATVPTLPQPAPMVTHPIVQRTGRFPQALLLSAALTLLSPFAYLLLVRRPIQATDGSDAQYSTRTRIVPGTSSSLRFKW